LAAMVMVLNMEERLRVTQGLALELDLFSCGASPEMSCQCRAL